jgi:xylose isomerase
MGADPFGPVVRKEVPFAAKIREYKKLGFDGVQFHDDDVVEADLDFTQTMKGVAKVRKMLEGEGLFCEFIAPRLWEHPKTIDGAYTSNNASERKYAIERSKRAIDIANAIGCRDMVLWLAREGTYIREAKCPITAVGRIVDAVNAMLAHDPKIRILGEMKPNEPMDQAYLPTVGHFMGLVYRTSDPSRVGVLIESAHSILAGLDPSDDMAYALWHDKLWSVHLNDQNGPKYDQDKTFASVDLRRAFNTVWVLERAGYQGCIGLDVKAMRTTKQADQTHHLSNSKKMFEYLVQIARRLNVEKVEAYRAARDYEGLEMFILETLMGKS